MPVITFASTKGGAGKTTACIVLASIISETASVALIDADPAGRLMNWIAKGAPHKNITSHHCIDEEKIVGLVKACREKSDIVLIDLEGVRSRMNSFAIVKSDLVIVPMGDEQQDGEAAIETLASIATDEDFLDRKIPARVLFTRVKAAVKARSEKETNRDMRANVPCFETELVGRTAYSSMHRFGGRLQDLEGVGGLQSAISNAESFGAEVIREIQKEYA